MKQLTLIRHAKSSHDDPTLPDFRRTLNERGLADAPRMGRHLVRELQWRPGAIFSSPANRALTTARLMALELKVDVGIVREVPEIYEASVPTLAAVVRKAPDTIPHLCLVGHNPGMENFSNWLLGQTVISAFVTCGVAILKLKLKSWRDLRPGSGELVDFLVPRSLVP